MTFPNSAACQICLWPNCCAGKLVLHNSREDTGIRGNNLLEHSWTARCFKKKFQSLLFIIFSWINANCSNSSTTLISHSLLFHEILNNSFNLNIHTKIPRLITIKQHLLLTVDIAIIVDLDLLCNYSCLIGLLSKAFATQRAMPSIVSMSDS